MIDRASLKYQAKLSMKSAKPSGFLVTFVMLLINYVITSLDMSIQLGDVSEYYTMLLEGYYPEHEVGFFGSLISFVLTLMSAVIAFGYSFYALKVSRDQQAGVGELFDGFGIFIKVIALSLVMGIFVFLWSLLFIIPGIIASYRYSMAYFILMDNPELPVMECLRRSKALTQGYKGSLFVLDLSFIGWQILTIIPFVSIFVEPYYRITLANYYNELTNWCPEPEQPVYEYDYKEPWEK